MASMEQCDSGRPLAMDRHLDVLRCQEDGSLLLGASCLTGRYWLGSLWLYTVPDNAPDVDKCTAGVQLEAGLSDAQWVDSTHVIVALDTGGIALWSLVDQSRTFLLSYSAMGHDNLATGVSVSCDKTKAVSCGYDQCIKEWDLSNMSLLSSHRAHTDSITCTDCHPSDPNLFVSCAQDGRLLLWDKRKAKPASILQTSPLSSTPTCVQWQPQTSHKMAVGSEVGQFALLDTRKGVENYLTSSPHSRPIHRLQFSPNDPSILATVGEDCQTVVSHLEEDGVTNQYCDQTHTDFVHGLSWSRSSELYTCGWDSKVVCHNVKRKMATILGGCGGQSSVPTVMNGEAGSTTDEEAGVNGGEGEGSVGVKSYSKVLQNGTSTTPKKAATTTTNENGNCVDMESEG